MIKKFPDLPDWSFEMDEVSAGVYEIIGKDKYGHQIRSQGTDLDILVWECRTWALELITKPLP